MYVLTRNRCQKVSIESLNQDSNADDDNAVFES